MLSAIADIWERGIWCEVRNAWQMLLSGWLNDARGELLAEFKVASFCSTIEAIMEANC